MKHNRTGFPYYWMLSYLQEVPGLNLGLWHHSWLGFFWVRVCVSSLRWLPGLYHMKTAILTVFPPKKFIYCGMVQLFLNCCIQPCALLTLEWFYT